MRNRLIVAVALSIVFAAPALAAPSDEITPEQVSDALAARRQASSSLEAATARFEEAVVAETQARESIVALSKSVSLLEREIATKRAGAEDLVVSWYTSGGRPGSIALFSAQTFMALPVQSAYAKLLQEADLQLLRELESVEADYVRQQAQLAATLDAQVALVAEIGGLAEQILSTLELADSAYNAIAVAYDQQEEEKRLRALEEQRLLEEQQRKAAAEAVAREAAEEAARAATSTTTTTHDPATDATTTTTHAAATTTTVDAGSTTSTTVPSDSTTTTTQPPVPTPVVTEGKTCPINAATSFSDTWGAARSGGRSHKGVDISAARSAPVVAIESGRITRTSNSSLGGFSIYLTGDSGTRYYYAHLEGFASGVRGGTVVAVGELVGYNGSSGNAPAWLPHVHFQLAPPGEDWINPYPLVKALCG